MTQKRWLYFALGVTTVISIGAVTNQLVPLTTAGVAIGDQGIIFPDGSRQTTAWIAEPPATFYEPHFLDFMPEVDSAWRFSNGWTHDDSGTSDECLWSKLEAPAGTSISSIDINYIAASATMADVVVAGLRTTTGSASPVDRLRYNLVNADAPFPASTSIGTVNVTHEAADVPLGLKRELVGDDRFDTMIGFCLDDPFGVSSIRVNFG